MKQTFAQYFLTENRTQVLTPEFQKWFAGSKVVDKDGKPLIVYHGTAEDFTQFNTGKRVGLTNTTIRQWGSFFTPSQKNASEYAWYSMINTGEGGNVKPVYLRIINPKELSFQEFQDFIDWGYNPDAPKKYEKERYAKAAANEFKKQALANGHDGFIIRNDIGEIIEIVAFSPNQIKSATGNKGTFNPSNPDIRH